MRVSLDFHCPDGSVIDAGVLLPEKVLRAAQAEIERLPVSVDGENVMVGDLCNIECQVDAEDELIYRGDTSNCQRIGAGMQTGRLVVEGNTGWGAGMEMRAGEVFIRGSAGDCLGAAMHGGMIRVEGDAGDRCGASRPGQAVGMTGGLILVGGCAGRYAGARMRRGSIWVAGDVSEYCVERMLAGTVVCAGKLGRYAGLGMRRGSVIAGSAGGLVPGFFDAGQADPEWLRIYLRAMRERGASVAEGWWERVPRRFTGDHLEIERGEILVYEWDE